MRTRLSIFYFLQFAVWGCYLSTLGQLLGSGGLGSDIAWFYAAVGIVSLFMPAFSGHIADVVGKPRNVLAVCHFIGAIMMLCCWIYCSRHKIFEFKSLFMLYLGFLAFFMPTLALANTTTFGILKKNGKMAVDSFPKIRIWGTIGFVAAMWFVNSAWMEGGQFGFTFSDSHPNAMYRLQYTSGQFFAAAITGFITGIYALTLPSVKQPMSSSTHNWQDIFNLRIFKLFKRKDLRTFLIFIIFMGVCLQISNGYVVPFINHFMGIQEYMGHFVASNATLLFSISQISEAFCILLVGISLKRLGIRIVIFLAMVAWSMRFIFLSIGDPGSGLIWLILSMIVYGIAFNFLTISSHLYMENKCEEKHRGFGQGLVMMMSNGIGATCGIIAAGAIVNKYCIWETQQNLAGNTMRLFMGNWETVWLIFGLYAFIVGIAFLSIFKDKISDNSSRNK